MVKQNNQYSLFTRRARCSPSLICFGNIKWHCMLKAPILSLSRRQIHCPYITPQSQYVFNQLLQTDP